MSEGSVKADSELAIKLAELTSLVEHKPGIFSIFGVAIAAVAMPLAFGAAWFQSELNSSKSVILSLENQQQTLEIAFSKIQSNNDSIKALSEQILSVASEDFAFAAISEKQERDAERLSALEKTLDLQPREVIQLLLLERELKETKQSLQTHKAVLQAGIDRANTLTYFFSGAILLSILTIFLGRLFQFPSRRK